MIKKRIAYLDILRALAIVAVVVLHVAAQNWSEVATDTGRWAAFNIFDGAMRWCVPVFLMISGGIFLGREDITLEKVLRKYLPRLALAFVVWTVIYALYKGLDEDYALHLVQGEYHMWYLFAIAGMYLLTPLLREIVKREEYRKYILGIIGAMLVAETGMKVCAAMGLEENAFVSAARYNYGHLTLGLSGSFVAYYILGYYLARTKLSGGTGKYVLLYLAGAGMTIWATALASPEQAFPGFFANFTLGVALEAAGVYLAVRSFVETRKMKVGKVTATLAECSFGIYLSHVLVIYILKDCFGLDTLSLPAMVSVPAMAMIVLAASWGGVYILRKSRVLRRVL